MSALLRRTLPALFLVCLALFLLPAYATAQTEGSVSAGEMPGPPQFVSGVPAAFYLYADATAPTGGYEGPTYSNLTWTWSATGPGTHCFDTSVSASTPVLYVTLSPPGDYKITVKATATWDVSTGGTVSVHDCLEVSATMVGVQKLQYTTDFMNPFVDVEGVLYVRLQKYLSLNFQAISTAGGASFAGGPVVWSGSSGATGTGTTTSVLFDTASTSPTDYKTVTATCGDTSVTAYVIVYDAPSPYTPVTVVATGGTFSPDPAPVGTWVDVTLNAKATRPTPGGSATLGSPSWSWNVVEARYSTESETGPWIDGSGSYCVCIDPTSAPSPDGTYDYSAMVLSTKFAVGGYWQVSTNAQASYTDSDDVEYVGADVAQAKGVEFDVTIVRKLDGTYPEEVVDDGSIKNVLPGSLVYLRAKVKPGGAKVTFKWTTPPGVVFKNYEISDTKAKLTSLAEGDLNARELEFYWADTGDRTVKCTVTGEIPKDYMAKLTVQKPDVTFTTKIGETQIINKNSLQFAKTKDTDRGGIDFNGKVEVPAQYPAAFSGGTWHFTQIVQTQMYRWRTEDDGKTFVKKKYSKNSTNEWRCDAAFSYKYAGIYALASQPINTDDSPSMGLDPKLENKVQRNTSFQMYVMFKPKGDNSRYVPLKKVDWVCGGTATWDGTDWILSDVTDSKAKQDPVDWSTHPTWEDEIAGGTYVQDK